MTPAVQRQAASSFFRQLVRDWLAHKVPRLAAALAYYAAFSLAPLLIAAIAVAGFFFGAEAARGEVVAQFQSFVGRRGAEAIEAMLTSSVATEPGAWAAVVGVAALIFGASGVFGELQDALNTIWEVAPKPGASWTTFLQRRFFSFAMVLGSGFLLLVSLLISAGLTVAGRYFTRFAPDAEPVWRIVDGLVGLAVPTVLFALTFKYVPDARVDWRDAWLGAVWTSALFTIGRWAIGYYLGRRALDSTFGAAASLVVVILWVYYSAHILFLGAELAQVSGDRRQARPVPPVRGAVKAPVSKRR